MDGTTVDYSQSQPKATFEMAQFLQTETGIHNVLNVMSLGLETTLKPPQNPVIELDPEGFAIARQITCLILNVYSTFDLNSRLIAPKWDALGKVFEPEKDVVIGQLDGDQYLEFSNELNVTGYPAIMAIKSDQVIAYDYSIPITRASLVDFVNTNCDKQRQPNGHLKESVGVDPEMISTVETFMTKPDLRSELVSNAEDIYAQVMQMIIDYGEVYIKQEIGRLQILLKSTWPSRAFQDENQVLLNVLNQFASFLV